ncbi:MAG: PAS domain-containing protein [Acidobacteriota bacterium]
MNRQNIIERILESLPKSIVAADQNHIITYMNKSARDEHTDLVGKSLLSCHNEESVKKIHEISGRLEAGEKMISLREEDGIIKSYFKAVRNDQGEFVGYYELMDKRT